MKITFKRAIVLALSVAVAATSLAGCSTAETSPSGGTLTIGTTLAPPTFAVADSQWANAAPYLQAVYDGLVRAAPDGEILPWLATEWSFDETGTLLTMTLRDDVEFTDGTKFTASVAVENLKRFLEGTSPQKGNLATVTDVEAPDETTLTLTLSAPNPALLTYLSQNPGLMESPNNFGAPDEQTTPVGSGPYTLDTAATVTGATYVFTANPDYWAKEDQHYSEVVMNVYDTPTAVLNAIQGGQVNGAQLQDNSTNEQVTAAGFTVNGTVLNFAGIMLWDRAGTLTPALSDVRVRQAINYGIDREALLEAVGQGYGDITSQIFNPKSSGFVESLDNYYSYDPEKAKSLLAAAGYSPGEITLTQPEIQGRPPATYALFKTMMSDIGIEVSYVPADLSTVIGDTLGGKYSSAFLALQVAPTSWQNITLHLAPTAQWNPFRYEDPTVARYAEIVQTGSDEDAAAAAKQLNQYVVEQAWYAPWYRPLVGYATDSNTVVEMQTGNGYPYLWNIKPKG